MHPSTPSLPLLQEELLTPSPADIPPRQSAAPNSLLHSRRRSEVDAPPLGACTPRAAASSRWGPTACATIGVYLLLHVAHCSLVAPCWRLRLAMRCLCAAPLGPKYKALSTVRCVGWPGTLARHLPAAGAVRTSFRQAAPRFPSPLTCSWLRAIARRRCGWLCAVPSRRTRAVSSCDCGRAAPRDQWEPRDCLPRSAACARPWHARQGAGRQARPAPGDRSRPPARLTFQTRSAPPQRQQREEQQRRAPGAPPGRHVACSRSGRRGSGPA